MGENSGSIGTKEIRHNYDLPDEEVINLVPRISKVSNKEKVML